MSFNVSPCLPNIKDFGFHYESKLQLAMSYTPWKAMLLSTVVIALLLLAVFSLDYFSPMLSILCLPAIAYLLFSHSRNKSSKIKAENYYMSVAKAELDAKRDEAKIIGYLAIALTNERDIASKSDRLKRILVPRARSHFNNNSRIKFWNTINEIKMLLLEYQQSIDGFIESVDYYYKTLNQCTHTFPPLSINDTKDRHVLIQGSCNSIQRVLDGVINNTNLIQSCETKDQDAELSHATSVIQRVCNDLSMKNDALNNLVQPMSHPSDNLSHGSQNAFAHSILNVLIMSGQ